MPTLADLAAISREYGSDPFWVLAGGGNTSLKEGDLLYVKASGFPLATIDEEGFARMDRGKLAAIWDADYPVERTARESRALEDLMAARVPGEERRPSVETLVHDVLPWTLTVHLHPALVNGMTCGARGREIAGEIFGDRMIWIPVVDPGYVLARTVRDALAAHREAGHPDPDYVFLENHGVFVGGEDADEVRKAYRKLKSLLEARLVRPPGPDPTELYLSPEDANFIEKAAQEIHGSDASFVVLTGGELGAYLAGGEAARPLASSLTPDHIVYTGPGAISVGPIGTGTSDPGAIWRDAEQNYRDRWGKPPNVVIIPDTGALVAAASPRDLGNAVALLGDNLRILAYAESFGGPSFMEEGAVRFIVEWEAENYRKKQS